jgi:uncharacterized protein
VSRLLVPPSQVSVAPLSQFVLKVHSRCDLACDHCYVYEAADQSWRGRPIAIPDAVISQAAQRIAEHAAAHALGTVQVVLHGGEPLLAGRARLERVVTELHSALRGICRLDLRIHTNGVLLSEDFCEFFAAHGVRVGISIDGDRAANDRHRRYADGRSSYDKVIRAVRLLGTGRFRALYAGLLCTIDVANDPVLVYQSLMELRPPRIDFLLPHATWDHPPYQPPATATAYADWLIAIFDRWLADGRPAQIRTFDSILSTLGGGQSFTEALGLEPTGLVVIETDGSYEQVDSLKAAFDGAPQTGANVFDHALDVVGGHPGILARQQGIAGLCQTCQECPVVGSCGGGLYTHRYRTGAGFANPSVYCADLLKLICHIARRRAEQDAAGTGVGIPAHAISGRDLQALAAGLGDATAMTQLIEAQRSLMRALLGAVYQEGTSCLAVSAAVRADLREAWSLLTALDREQPRALEAVLDHPYLRVWATRCLRQLRLTARWRDNSGQPGHVRVLEADLGYAGAIAAAAATAARTVGRVRIPVIDGAVYLPTLGGLAVSRAGPGRPLVAGPELAAVDVGGDEVRVRLGESRWTLASAALNSGQTRAVVSASGPRSAAWEPVRKLSAPGIRVALEDTDPHRDCYRQRPARRLNDADFSRWQQHFQDAWREIERDHAAYAPALAAGLTTLTPLNDAPDGSEPGAVARHAFGAIALAPPADPAALALLLIHEFQHVKLGAILDLFDLYDPVDDRLFHARGAVGKLRLEELWQDAYAHMADAGVWRARQHASPDQVAEVARQRLEHCQALIRDAIQTLVSTGSLTPLGTWFVREMRHSDCP